MTSRNAARQAASTIRPIGVCLQPREIPDGWVAGVEDPAGNVIYVFDQTPETGAQG